MVDELLTEARQYILSGSNIISKSRVEAECKKIRMKIQNPPAAVTLKVDSADYFNDADRSFCPCVCVSINCTEMQRIDYNFVLS